MSDLMDIGAVLIIILFIVALWFMHDRERTRVAKMMDNSVGEKYMQLMAAFMKGKGARLIDMSPGHADMRIIDDENSEETLSINQNENEVNICWAISNGPNKLKREFKFTNNETQEEIMEVVASGITKVKNEMS
jgi:hypothetical protein